LNSGHINAEITEVRIERPFKLSQLHIFESH
jgi:hypothetical protein